MSGAFNPTSPHKARTFHNRIDGLGVVEKIKKMKNENETELIWSIQNFIEDEIDNGKSIGEVLSELHRIIGVSLKNSLQFYELKNIPLIKPNDCGKNKEQ